MPYCRNCGKQLDQNVAFCPNCGASQKANTTQDYNPSQIDPYESQRYDQNPRRRNLDPYDSGSFGWAILGFFIPLVGLILFLVWAQTKPKSAKMAGIGALVNVIMTVLFYVLYFVLILALSPSSSTGSILLW